MINKIIAVFRSNPTVLRERFMARFAGKTIIVHDGLSIGWVSELVKEAGGGAHFRIDARRQPGRRPTPIEWVVHQQLLPHKLPMPFLVKVEDERLLVRHLMRNDMPVHPSEIYWMLTEFPDNHHLLLSVAGKGFIVKRGMSVAENAVNLNATWAGSEDEF
ncbi:MAG: hypothetical protein P4L77_06735 [Sulfuriferula sp.]|nr:hypothetical protein [Sulfuriferula sp.]